MYNYVFLQTIYLTVCELFRLRQSVLCLRRGRESVDGAEGHRAVVWEVRHINLHRLVLMDVSHLTECLCLCLFVCSACTSASLEPSYVLRAIGADEDLAHSSIRYKHLSMMQ